MNPRIPRASGVLPYTGTGLGLPTTTTLPTRQWSRPRPTVRQVVPIDWRPQGPDRTFTSESAAPQGGATSDCEDC